MSPPADRAAPPIASHPSFSANTETGQMSDTEQCSQCFIWWL